MGKKKKKTTNSSENAASATASLMANDLPTEESIRSFIIGQLQNAAPPCRLFRELQNEALANWPDHPLDTSRLLGEILLDIMENRDDRLALNGRRLCLIA